MRLVEPPTNDLRLEGLNPDAAGTGIKLQKMAELRNGWFYTKLSKIQGWSWHNIRKLKTYIQNCLFI